MIWKFWSLPAAVQVQWRLIMPVNFSKLPRQGNLPIVDTVGAGDAFSAVLLLGMQQGWSLSETMERAQSFASAMVSQRGAIVQDLIFYQTFIRAWNLD